MNGYSSLLVVLIASWVASSLAQASGFEKTNVVSARYTGIGSAAVSSVEGSESIIFNPAGLARAKGLELTLDSALGLAKTSAPLISNGTSPTTGASPVDSKLSVIPIAATAISYSLTDRLSFGGGLSVSGGAGADYGPVDFGPSFAALSPELNSKFGILEALIGAGYEPLDGLRLGATWRILIIKADSKSGALLDANTLLALQFTDASGVSYNGFRFGAQYSPKDSSWGLGATVRTPVDFKATGQSSGSLAVSNSSTVVPVSGGEVTLASTFPLQIALGAHEELMPKLRIFQEYSFTRNSSISGLNTSGTALTIPGASAPIPVETFSTPLHWHNMHQLRLGAEMQATEDWTLRGGYVLSSQVIPDNEANPFFAPPGIRHTFTAGASKQLTSRTRLDGALEFETSSGTASGSSFPSLDGSYRYHVFAFYLGAAHAF
jgi:long-subunit fatty acid transport protein